MSRSIRNETSSLAFGILGRFGGSSAGFVVTALNAASAASREVAGLRVLSVDIVLPFLGFAEIRQGRAGSGPGGWRRSAQHRAPVGLGLGPARARHHRH